MLRSGGMYANLRSCYSVLCGFLGGVDDNVSIVFLSVIIFLFVKRFIGNFFCAQYVRVVAHICNRWWQDKYCDVSLRYMLDPTFGV